jgi:hypothetical protein
LDIEAKLVQKYIKVKFGRVTGSSTGFSFDNQLDKRMKSENNGKVGLPEPSEYALRAVAIRDGRYYLPMTYSPTYEYLDTFVAHAINAPLTDFIEYGGSSSSSGAKQSIKSNEPSIHILKRTSGFKQRASTAYRGDGGSSSSNSQPTENESEHAARIEEVRKRREARKLEQRAREEERAEKMAKEGLNRLFEEDDEERDDKGSTASDKQSKEEIGISEPDDEDDYEDEADDEEVETIDL